MHPELISMYWLIARFFVEIIAVIGFFFSLEEDMNHYLKLQGVLFILILLTPSLSGCGFKDIDKRIFVVSVGVDPAKNSDKKFLISLKLAVPNVQEVSNEFVIISEEGDTIAEAVRIMKAEVDKELDFSHAKLIVYNEKILKFSK